MILYYSHPMKLIPLSTIWKTKLSCADAYLNKWDRFINFVSKSYWRLEKICNKEVIRICAFLNDTIKSFYSRNRKEVPSCARVDAWHLQLKVGKVARVRGSRLAGCKVETVWEKILAELSCSLHGSWQIEREERSQG